MNYNYLLNIVSKHYSIEENIYLLNLLKSCKFEDKFFDDVKEISNNLINESRKNLKMDTVENILNEYNLTTKEGIQMMCLAESLLRIPDFITSDSFMKDKIIFQKWDQYYETDYWKILIYNILINFISKLFYKKSKTDKKILFKMFKKMTIFFSNCIMKKIGKKFVYSNNIKDAILKSLTDKNVYSFDMLGEAAITFYDARKFYNQYKKSINNIEKIFFNVSIFKIPTISIKLSALHPKYSFLNRIKVIRDLIPLIKSLINEAKKARTSITIDAEECDRMELSFILFNKIYYSNICSDWNNFGIVIQAYSKRSLPSLFWLSKISYERKRIIPIRLVKGAYWDYEVKLSQIFNLNTYPVFTNKFCTDLSYLLCSMFLLSEKIKNFIFPQFATHNAQTIAIILYFSKKKNIEFQKLYGMGDYLYKTLKNNFKINFREYAPIGKYKELLPYLVRRLLENGANSSFVNKIIIRNTNFEKLTQNPFFIFLKKKYNIKIPNPLDIYGGYRNPIQFYNLNISFQNYIFYKKIIFFEKKIWVASSFNITKKKRSLVIQPSNNYTIVGVCKHDYNIKYSINILRKTFTIWNKVSLKKKIQLIKNFVNLLKKNFIELIILCSREAGKTILDCISDIKEAIDFCRYYCNQSTYIYYNSILPNITGENNIFLIEGKGIFATISPWNFPIAIFCGQTIAALISGNVVLAKPAENTSLIAHKVFQILYKSGIPLSCCQIIIGSGSYIGNMISFNKNIYGIIFTGSNIVANKISKNLIMRDNRPIHKIIAETGGLNVMLVDSTALIEQVVLDIIESAFKSCGQRCSALRLVYINENIFIETIKILLNSLISLNIGDPLNLENDIGPLISLKSLKNLKKYINNFKNEDVYINKIDFRFGYFIEPTIIRINSIKDMKSEQFGPILHISIYKNDQINLLIEDINSSEFGLTFGIHSRNESFYKYLSNKIKVGNIYVNRNTIGAVVGMQPFGGCNLSGTGPKAGGFNYLLSLINEKTVTINTTAQGGNVELLNE